MADCGARMTAREKRTRARLTAFARKHLREKVQGVRHVHPLGYVIGYAGPMCLVVALPWMDSEPQMREWDQQNGVSLVRRFAPSLKPGDWCAVGYVYTATSGERVAVEAQP